MCSLTFAERLSGALDDALAQGLSVKLGGFRFTATGGQIKASREANMIHLLAEKHGVPFWTLLAVYLSVDTSEHTLEEVREVMPLLPFMPDDWWPHRKSISSLIEQRRKEKQNEQGI
jgi:hypothetical protein